MNDESYGAGRVLRSSKDDAPAIADATRGCPPLPAGDLWVFAYGSLMWNPGFEYMHAKPAILRGYHRVFCVYSVRGRGTPERPGLVLGLVHGGGCRGVAFRVAQTHIKPAVDLLWAREMRHRVYHARVVPVAIAERKVQALTFIADRAHERYAGRLELEEIARIIADGNGARGPNADYLFNTLRHLEELGIRERRLNAIAKAVQALQRPGDVTPRSGV